MDKVVVALLLLMIWVVAWNVAAERDRTVCAAYGAEYAGTSLMLDGYCLVTGIEVKAESLSWKN